MESLFKFGQDSEVLEKRGAEIGKLKFTGFNFSTNLLDLLQKRGVNCTLSKFFKNLDLSRGGTPGLQRDL